MKKYTLYFKTGTYLVLFHALGHFYGHYTTFVDSSGASPDLTNLFQSMARVKTAGGNEIWDLFIMFSASYTVFQVMIAVLNLLLVYTRKTDLALMRKIITANVVLWTFAFAVFSFGDHVTITLISNSIFILFYLIAFFLIRNQTQAALIN